MFAKTIVLSDDFLDLDFSTRCLYYSLCMVADDDGFINNAKSVIRQTGTSQADLDKLLEKRFVLGFDSGVIVIKAWKINNYIAKDRYKETQYKDEKSMLTVNEKGAYTECIQPVYNLYTPCIQSVYTGKVSKDKVSLDKNSVVECSSIITATTTETKKTDEFDQIVENSVENSVEKTDAVENSKDRPQLISVGTLGKGVVFLTQRQIDSLLDIIGFDAFNEYVTRLADFIIEKKARVKNHYETILKWHKEDSDA